VIEIARDLIGGARKRKRLPCFSFTTFSFPLGGSGTWPWAACLINEKEN